MHEARSGRPSPGLRPGAFHLPALATRRRRRRRHAADAGAARRRAARRLRAEAELLRPRSRHRVVRRGPAPPLRVPPGEGRRADERARQGLLRGRQHPDARHLDASPQGELLQVHERDPQRDRGCDPVVRAGLAGRDPGNRRRRRLRARARVRRDHPDRRPVDRSVTPRGPLAGGAPGHRRADPRRRQAPRPARPRRRVRDPHRRGAGPAGSRLGSRRRTRSPEPVRRRGLRACVGARRGIEPCRHRTGDPPHTVDPRRHRRRPALPAPRGADRPRQRCRTFPSPRTARSTARLTRRAARRGRGRVDSRGVS